MRNSILLVDDNPAVLTATANYLQQSGFDICGLARNGVEALEVAATLCPDLIVMDLAMPRMNGLEAARQLTKRLPHIPIVLLTSHKSVLQPSDIELSGVASVISKSDDPQRLKTVIRALLDTPVDVFLARRSETPSGFGY